MTSFWPKPDWHANGLPTPEELRAMNEQRRAIIEQQLKTEPPPKIVRYESFENFTTSPVCGDWR